MTETFAAVRSLFLLVALLWLATLNACAGKVWQIADSDMHLRSAAVQTGAAHLGLVAPGLRGPVGIKTEDLTMAGTWQPRISCRLYQPEAPVWKGTIILGHGFLRNKECMDGWGRWLGSHGYRVLTLSFGNSSPLAGNHDLNGADMVAIAAQVPGPVLYAGFSAGGLAALLAAATDSNSAGWLGLDAVDWNNQAAGALGILAHRSVPVLALWTEPGDCNAKGNMRSPVDAHAKDAGWTQVLLQGASHFLLEDPLDGDIAGLCGSTAPPDAAGLIQDEARLAVLQWLRRIHP